LQPARLHSRNLVVGRLLAALVVGAVLMQSQPYAVPQTNGGNQATGQIAGTIRPKHGLAFDVYLMVPGTGNVVAHTAADFLDGHGTFLLDGIRPGIYRLDVESLPVNGCGILPWSQIVAVGPGETVHVKVKLKVARHAICE